MLRTFWWLPTALRIKSKVLCTGFKALPLRTLLPAQHDSPLCPARVMPSLPPTASHGTLSPASSGSLLCHHLLRKGLLIT